MGQKPMDISKIQISRGSAFDPVEYKGIVYFGESSGYFRAVDQNTGREFWSIKTGHGIEGSVSLDDGCLYFGSIDKFVYCVSPGGKILWRVMTGGPVVSTPQVYEDMIYFGSCDGNVRALSKVNGGEIWRFPAGEEIVGDLLVRDDRIYFGAMNGKVYCLDLSGNVMWEYQTDDAILTGQPVIHENILYIGSSDQCVYALSIDNGLPVWRFWTGDMVQSRAVYHEGVLYFGSRDAHFYAVDAKSGRELWKFRTEYPIPSKPVIYEDKIYFGSDKLYCLTLSGDMLEEYPVRDIIVGEALVLKDGIFFVCMDGVLRKLTFDFDLIWSIKTKDQNFAPHFGLFKPTNANPDFLGKRAERARNQNKPVLEQEMEFYELRMGAGGLYGGGAPADGLVHEISEGPYRSGDLGSSSQYKDANSPGAYGLSKDFGNEDGKDDNGKILKKFLWE